MGNPEAERRQHDRALETQKIEMAIAKGGRVDVPPALAQWIAEPHLLYIDGFWTEGETRETFETVNPATGKKLADIALATRRDVDRAVAGARAAYESGSWAYRTLAERAAQVSALGELILRHRSQLAVLETLDTGKPIRESFEGDIVRAAKNFQFFGEFALSEELPRFSNAEDEHETFREPIGVVALVTPWNLPLYLETWKLAPALLMGNSCILKASELTPLTASYLAKLVEEAGFPPGVFQLVQGLGEGSTGEFLTSHPGVDAISFTGETSTGRAIQRAAAVGPTRCSFELGGKGASVVFETADLDEAVQVSVRAAFRNQGEICLANPRVYVHAKRYDEFRDKFVAEVKKITVGDPLDGGTTMGALISKGHREKVLGYVAEAKKTGKILLGGDAPSRDGFFVAPTVVEDLPPDSSLHREEIFGPVVTLHRFESETEVVAAVNATPYGLSASIWTRDHDQADRVAKGVRTGLVWVNCWFVRDLRVPFGGQKRSGVGREGGRHSLDFFSEWKSVCYKKKERRR